MKVRCDPRGRTRYLTSSFVAVKQAIDASSISDKIAAYEGYLKAVSGKSNSEAKIVAQDILGEPVFWDWDRKYHVLVPDSLVLIPGSLREVPRTREGYYHCTAGIEVCLPVARVSDFAMLISICRWPSSELLLSLHTPTWFGWRPRHPTWNRRNLSLEEFGNSIPESERLGVTVVVIPGV